MPRHAGLLTVLFLFFLTWSGALLESTTSEQVDHRLSSGQHVGYLMCVDRAYGLSLQYLVHSYRKIFVCSQNWMSFQHSSMSIHWYLPVTSVCVISTLDCLGNDGLKWMWCHNRHTHSLFHDGYLSVHSTGLSNFFHIYSILFVELVANY